MLFLCILSGHRPVARFRGVILEITCNEKKILPLFRLLLYCLCQLQDSRQNQFCPNRVNCSTRLVAAWAIALAACMEMHDR